MDKIINISHLKYSYLSENKSFEALKGINLSVNAGEIFGFIGPNGAGKTTTIKLLLGILFPQSGNITIFEEPTDIVKSRQKIGYMPEVANYYDFLTPIELLLMYGNLFGIKKKVLLERAGYLLKLMGLIEVKNKKLKTFSKGMMQKISFAQSLINDPCLLILDEPNSGLDPVSRIGMREIILELKRNGKTIFFSSHELSEVELICDRIGIINQGQLIRIGTVNEITEEGEPKSLEKCFLKIVGENL